MNTSEVLNHVWGSGDGLETLNCDGPHSSKRKGLFPRDNDQSHLSQSFLLAFRVEMHQREQGEAG